MKTAIKLLALAFVMLIGTASFAQKPKPKQQTQHKHMNKDSAFAKVSKRLNLTAEQQTKLKVIMKQNHDEMKALKASIKNATKEEKRKAVVAQMQKNDERVKQVLNEQKKTEYDKIKAEHKAEMRKNRETHKADKNQVGNRNKSTAPAQTKPEQHEGDHDEDILDDGIL